MVKNQDNLNLKRNKHKNVNRKNSINYNQVGGSDLIDISKLADANYIKRLDGVDLNSLGLSLSPSGDRSTYDAKLMGLESSDSRLFFPSLKEDSNSLNSDDLLEVDELIKITNESEKARTSITAYLKEIQGSKFPMGGDYVQIAIDNIGFKADGIPTEPSLLKKGIENMIELNKARGEYDIDCVAEVYKKRPEEMWGSLESALGWKHINLIAYAFFSPRQLGHMLADSLSYSSGSASHYLSDHLDFLRQNFAMYEFSDTIVSRLYNGARLQGNDSLKKLADDKIAFEAKLEKLKDSNGGLMEGDNGLLALVYKVNIDPENTSTDNGLHLLQFLQGMFLYSTYNFLGKLREEINKATVKNEKLSYRSSIVLKQIDGYVKLYSWVLASLFELDEERVSILRQIRLSESEWKNVRVKMASEFPIIVNSDKTLNVDATSVGFYKLFSKYQPKKMPFFGVSMDSEIARCSVKFIKNYYTEMKTLVDKINKKSSKVREELGKKVPREEIIKIRDSITNVLDKVATNPNADQRNNILQTFINSLTLQYAVLRTEFHKLVRLNILDTAHLSKSGIKEFTKEQQDKEIKKNQLNLRSEALVIMINSLYKDYMNRYNKENSVIFPAEFLPVLLYSMGKQDSIVQSKIILMFKEKLQNHENKDVVSVSVSQPIKPAELIYRNAGSEDKQGPFHTLQGIEKMSKPSVNGSSTVYTSSTSSSSTHPALAKPTVSTATQSSGVLGADKIEAMAKQVIKPEFWDACYSKLEKKLYLPIYYNNAVGLLDVFKVGIDGKISADPFPMSSSDYVYYFPATSVEKGLKRTEDVVRGKGIIMITDKMGNIGNMKDWMALSGKVYREHILKNKNNAVLLRAHLFNIMVNDNIYREEVDKSIGDTRIAGVWGKYCSEYGFQLENCNIILAREVIMAYLGTVEKVDLKNSKLALPYRMVSSL